MATSTIPRLAPLLYGQQIPIGILQVADIMDQSNQQIQLRPAPLFCFKPVPVSFGPMDEDSCGTILYPNSIRNLIDFALQFAD